MEDILWAFEHIVLLTYVFGVLQGNQHIKCFTESRQEAHLNPSFLFQNFFIGSSSKTMYLEITSLILNVSIKNGHTSKHCLSLFYT